MYFTYAVRRGQIYLIGQQIELDDLVLFFIFSLKKKIDLVYLIHCSKTTPPAWGFQPQMEIDA
jgi:hypothetical protein